MSETTAPQPTIIEVAPRHTGEPARVGEILEVLGAPGHVHYLVRWDDGHQSIYYPSNDARVR